MAGRVLRDRTIARNKKAHFGYELGERLEAGLALEGWEVKSLRQGRAQIDGSHVLLKSGEAYLVGATIQPLPHAEGQVWVRPDRTRKLLLSRRELSKLVGLIERSGYTCVCTSLYWQGAFVKCEVAVARGKKIHEKRAHEKQKDWDRQRQRLLRQR